MPGPRQGASAQGALVKALVGVQEPFGVPLQAENVRLRGLLNSTAMLRDDVLVAELIGVSPDPVRHQLVLNKGRNDGVFVGQPLIDADGLMGQIVEVSAGTSRALLITDATHSIPVQVNRNGVRAIAEGTGSLGELEVRHVSANTDIETGDLLVTSGLGGRFPGGYPVAVVTAIERDPGRMFARVVARPNAALDRSQPLLVVRLDDVAATTVVHDRKHDRDRQRHDDRDDRDEYGNDIFVHGSLQCGCRLYAPVGSRVARPGCNLAGLPGV